MRRARGLRGGLPVVLALTAGCLWGCYGLFTRGLNAYGLFGFQIAEARLFVTTLILGLFLLARDRSMFRVRPRDLWIFACAGILGMLCYNACYLSTVQATTMNLATGLGYTAPAFSLVFARIFFGERIDARKVITIVLILGGCAFLCDLFSGSLAASPVQIVIGMCTGLGYAFYGICSRVGLDRGYHPLTVLFYSFLFGAVGCAIPCDFGAVIAAVTTKPMTIWLLLGVALLCTIAPYLFYTISLKSLELSRATMLTSIEPVVATLLGFLVFSEVPGISQVIGVALIVIAVLVLNMPRRKRKAASTR